MTVFKKGSGGARRSERRHQQYYGMRPVAIRPTSVTTRATESVARFTKPNGPLFAAARGGGGGGGGASAKSSTCVRFTSTGLRMTLAALEFAAGFCGVRSAVFAGMLGLGAGFARRVISGARGVVSEVAGVARCVGRGAAALAGGEMSTGGGGTASDGAGDAIDSLGSIGMAL
jgi:hypothetical protein